MEGSHSLSLPQPARPLVLGHSGGKMRTEKIAQVSPLNGMLRELGREHWGRGEDRQASLPPFCTGPEGGMAQWASPHSLPSYLFGLLRIIL